MWLLRVVDRCGHMTVRKRTRCHVCTVGDQLGQEKPPCLADEGGYIHMCVEYVGRIVLAYFKHLLPA
jgi:hypothetical protein